MIRVLQSKDVDTSGKTWYRFSGDSTDSKPTGEYPAGSGRTVAVGSRFFENGTEIVYELKSDGWTAVGQQEVILENKTVTPTTSEQTITAGEGYDGIGTVTVEAVTAAIDSDITAGNIKKDVEILGVTGTLESIEFSATPAAFSLLENIRNLNMVIPDGVTNIAAYAFVACTGLMNVDIPDGVTSINTNAFQSCTGLTEIEIPSSVTRISSSVFKGCTGLTSVTLSDGLRTIELAAFSGCTGLTTIEIPSSVTTIGDSAFTGCTNLTQITVHKAQGSISGAPWGATNATVTWTG